MTADEDREIRRHRYVRASSRRVWRITAVACAAILGLGVGGAAFIQLQAQGARERRAQQSEIQRDRALSEQQAADIACVRKWAIAYNNRAEQINGLSEARNKALDTLLLAAIDQRPAARVRQLAAEYKALVIQRRETLADNPLPPSPEFECGLTDRQHPSHPSPTTAAPTRPSARPTSPPRTAGHTTVTPARSTRPATPARHDTSARAAGRVAPTRATVTPSRTPSSGQATTPRPAPSTSSTVLRFPLPLPVCVIVRPIVSTC